MAEPKCIKCALCCKRILLRVAPSGQKMEMLEAHYDRPVEMVHLRIRHRCAQLDENDRCRIYDKRPQQCVEFYCGPAKGVFERRLVLDLADEGKLT